jgi:hypothetical protein
MNGIADATLRVAVEGSRLGVGYAWMVYAEIRPGIVLRGAPAPLTWFLSLN